MTNLLAAVATALLLCIPFAGHAATLAEQVQAMQPGTYQENK